jgi:hypothetical protein
MVDVHMPDGSVLRLPDTKPRDQVRDMIATKFPGMAQQSGTQQRTYTIQAPDGRKITIRANDEATALRGAQEWVEANPAAGMSGSLPDYGPVSINIGNQQVKVDRRFLSLSPDEQNQTVEEIAGQIGIQPGESVFVKTPDGIAVFPAGTSTEVMERALQEAYRPTAGGASELARLEEGIRRAHAAGDAENVRILGQAYREMQGNRPGNAPPSPAYDSALAAASEASRKFTKQVGGERRFEIKTPDGRTYEVAGAADEQSALAALQAHLGNGASRASSPDLMGATAATLSGIVNGIPVIGPMAQNASDALVGAGAALSGGDYGQTVQNLRDRRQAFAEANPVANIAGNLVGGIGAYGALAKTASGAHALGLGPGMGMGARIGNSAASGAAITAADTYFKGGAPEEVLSSAVYGGAIGAVTPPLATAIGTAARAVGNKIAPTWAAATRPADEAARRTGLAVIRDRQANPSSVLNSADEEVARQAGVPLMNVDRGGETTRALARSVANQNPEAREIIRKAADDRFESQGLRAIDFIKRIGVDDLAYQQSIRDTAKFANAPRYRAAFEAPQAQAVWSPQIRQLMQSPMFRSAVNMAESRGADKAAITGFKAVKNPFQFNRDGSITLRVNPDGSRALPSLAFWNQVKINLDGMIERATRGAKPDRSLAADLTQMKNMLVADLDAAVPQYRSARQGAAAFFDAEDALEAGRKFANQPRSVPEAKRAFSAFSESEQQAFRTGYASELIDRIRSTRDRVNVINQVFGNQSSREMVELVFGKYRAHELEGYIRVENLADMIRGALGNSTTARQLFELGIGTGIGGGAGFLFSGGNMQGALAGAAIGGGRKAAQMMGQRVDAEVMKHVAKLLTSRDPSDLQKAIANAAMSPMWMRAINALEQALMIGPRASLPVAVGQ